jgi:hypothetical protein
MNCDKQIIISYVIHDPDWYHRNVDPKEGGGDSKKKET